MTWNEAAVQYYIDNEIQESLTLEYKAADALARTDANKREITKDVSAFANSAGGIILYGIREHQAPKKHLPEKSIPSTKPLLLKNGWSKSLIIFVPASTAC